jgi:DNA-binding CsgD family transcriptional regulator/tetratricopeptide (TPR) repeat protein
MQVLEAPSRDVAVALREGIERGVLVVDPASGLFRVRHELLREAIEAEVMPAERRQLHERFAAALPSSEAAGADGRAAAAAELAYHWHAAGKSVEAHAAALAAAREAEAVHAHADAYRQYRAAIELEPALPVESRPSPLDARETRRQAAETADLAGEFGEAVALVRALIDAGDTLADPTEMGLLHSRLGYLLWASGAPGSLDAHRQAVALVPGEPPSTARARVLARLAGSLLGAALWAECRDVAAEAIDHAVRVRDQAEESLARNIHGSVLVALGDIDAGIDDLRRSRELAEAAGAGDTLVIAHHNLGLNLLQADRFDEALAEANAGLDAARRMGLERRFGVDLGALVGEVLTRLGRWDEAAEALDAGRSLDPGGAGTTWLNAVAGRLAALRGDLAAAERLFAGVEREGIDADVAAETAAARAEWGIIAERPDEAASAVGDGLAALAGLDDVLWTAPLLALGYRAAADAGQADGTAALDGRMTELEGRARVATTAAWLATARAEHARLAGGEAPGAWAVARDAWAEVPDGYRVAEASLRWAEAELRQRGVGADVGDALEAAHGTAIELGARPLAAAIERLARRARVPLSRGAGTEAERTVEPGNPIAGLSSRELEVLGLLVAGLSNGEIGERLFISRKTAAVHVTHILDKLGVSNRVEAAMVAERAGWRG